MGKSMYNYGKRAKEIAMQQKQMEKASKRIMVKQQKANLITGAPDRDPDKAEPERIEEISGSIS